MRSRHFFIAIVAAASAAFTLVTPARATVYTESIEVPAQLTPIKGAGLFGAKPVAFSPILSERFAESKEGQRYFKRIPVSIPGEVNRIRTYRQPDLLQVATPGNTEVIIDVSKQRVYLMVKGQMALESQISTARSGKHTPRGTFHMTERVRSGKISNLYDVEMPFWMRLGETAYGVHAGYLPGYPASAGCIRLPVEAAGLIYQKTGRGSVVRILNTWQATPRAQPIAKGDAPADNGRPARATRPDSTFPVDGLGQSFDRIDI